MEYPIPRHLQEYLIPKGDKNTEYEVTGDIRCSCGGHRFEVWESNDRHIVQLICKECGHEILVLDASKHGWDGFVCHNDFLDHSLPLQKYICPDCGADAFEVAVFISSQGKQDFLEECVSHDDSFTLDDWVDGFEWITISLSCQNCDYNESDWVDLETM